MENNERIDKLTNKINEFWHRCPDLKFGQIAYLLVKEAKACKKDFLYIEDEDWEILIQRAIEKTVFCYPQK